ncbi:murein transglycosylase domain-containing protein [Desulfococcaceae bacterium HSG9]|nr:murein transglycosylase domain-containing protein [Desulfococcaceae bacterium HSG9]
MIFNTIKKIAILICLLLTITGCFSHKEPIGVNVTVSAIEKKWDTVRVSTAMSWVDYNATMDTRSEVDFANGSIKVETVLPAKTDRLKQVSEKKIASQAKKIFQTETALKSSILKDQVKNANGEIVSSSNVKKFVKHLTPKFVKKAYIDRNGVRRIKTSVKVKMVRNHINIRARQYAKIVTSYARKFGITPHLVLAIIHRESRFNPLAVSPGGALGLMQLIPRYGGKDAYKYIYKKNKIMHKNYFYDPQKNIELGVAYYYLLKHRYFDSIKNNMKKRYLSICAYNTGPTRIKRLVPLDTAKQLNAPQLYTFLKKKTPPETCNYLKSVTHLSKKYAKW